MQGLAGPQLEERDFERLRGLVRQHTGISMDASKRQLIQGRISRRLRSLKLASFAEYCELISAPASEELEAFMNAVTTNLTSFFREPGHFQFLASALIPQWTRQKRGQRVHIWSAGCSSGEEPYSIAMTMLESLPADSPVDWRVLATDLDSAMLARAQAAVYGSEQIEELPLERRRRWFLKGRGANEGRVRLKPVVRERVVFRRLNLMAPWPVGGPFDVIFCRNVAIYFDKPTQKQVFERFSELLADDGVLFVGHSESLSKVTDRLTLVRSTTYRKRT